MDDLEAPVGNEDYGNNEEQVTELLRKHEVRNVDDFEYDRFQKK